MKTRHEILLEDPEYRRLYAIEALVTDAAELVARLMEEQRVNKAELARRLGKSRAWVTQLLSGRANMTIRTFAEAVHALQSEVRLSAQALIIRSDDSSLLEQRAGDALGAQHLKAKPEVKFPLPHMATARARSTRRWG